VAGCTLHSKASGCHYCKPRALLKVALRERKRKASNIHGPDPEWLVQYVQDAWEPTTADLTPLRDALTPNYDEFRVIYQPIRHKVYAHRSKEDEAAISALFSRTVIGDVNNTLIWAIQEMAWNAARPNLADFTDYEGYVTGIKRKIEQFVRQLP
jgi:hypothetical protein